MVGADPDELRRAGTNLVEAAEKVSARSGGFDSVSASARLCGADPTVINAIVRFSTAFSTLSLGVGSEVDAMGRLSQVTADDLDRADGGGGGGAAPRAQ